MVLVVRDTQPCCMPYFLTPFYGTPYKIPFHIAGNFTQKYNMESNSWFFKISVNL